ncbi:MAG: hypothetical protein AAF610_11335 [Pseudomonadota bacterium]
MSWLRGMAGALIASTIVWPVLADTVRLDYRLDLRPAPGSAHASITVVQGNGALRELSFTADDARFVDIKAKDGLTIDDGRVTWAVPKKGGTLSWSAPITNSRTDESLDARLGSRWGLFRGEDAFPSMASRALADTEASAVLHVDTPKDWSFLTALATDGDGYRVENTERRIDRPAGWMIAGDIGVRIDRIAGVRCVVAAPKGQRVRRQDTLAMLNWVMPDLVRLLPDYPSDVLLVSAEDPFWRGGLSGPASLYLHSDRPLISENGTSTLVHELFHVGLRRDGGDLDDWIVEGLAEFYSVQLLRRSGTTTASRYAKTMRSLKRYAEKAGPLRGPRSRGATTARAVLVFAALDKELQTGAGRSLDDVVRTLAMRDDAMSLDELSAIVSNLLGAPSDVLAAIQDES